MTAMKDKGMLGELFAKEQLVREGYQIIAQNYFTRYGEIDLIVQKGETLVFVEVKTRSKSGWDRPADAVNKRKQQKICLAAQQYLQENPSDCWIRFDVFEVITRSVEGFVVEEHCHIKEAFIPS